MPSTKIVTLEARKQKLQGIVSGIEAQIQTLTDKVDQITEKIATLANRRSNVANTSAKERPIWEKVSRGDPLDLKRKALKEIDTMKEALSQQKKGLETEIQTAKKKLNAAQKAVLAAATAIYEQTKREREAEADRDRA